MIIEYSVVFSGFVMLHNFNNHIGLFNYKHLFQVHNELTVYFKNEKKL